MRPVRLFVLALLLAPLLPAPLLADAVSDALAAAQESYAAGDLPGTSSQLAAASRALAQEQKARLAAFLPEAPAGWTRQIDADEDEAPALMGLIGVTAEATYTSPEGESFTLTLAADNPMVMSMGAMLANPQMMAMMGKVVRVNGQDMLAQSDSLAALVGMRVLVQASGMAPEKMQPLLEGIDFGALAAFDRRPVQDL